MSYVFCAFQEHKLCNVDLKNAEAVERLGMEVSAGAMKNARFESVASFVLGPQFSHYSKGLMVREGNSPTGWAIY